MLRGEILIGTGSEVWKAGPGLCFPSHRYSEAALAGDVGTLVSARLHVGKLQLSREVPVLRSGREGQV